MIGQMDCRVFIDESEKTQQGTKRPVSRTVGGLLGPLPNFPLHPLRPILCAHLSHPSLLFDSLLFQHYTYSRSWSLLSSEFNFPHRLGNRDGWHNDKSIKTHSDETKRGIGALPDLITLLVCLFYLWADTLNELVACRKKDKFRKGEKKRFKTPNESVHWKRNAWIFQINVHLKLSTV